MPMDSATETDTPDREELLKAIDFEIEHVTTEHKKPGWTEWAIYGGLAVVFWAIVTFPYSESVSLVGTAQIVLTIYVLYDSLGVFRIIYEAGKNETSAWLSFHRQAYRISPRIQFASISTRLFLLVGAWIGLSNVWWPYAVVVLTWLILSILSFAYLFWMWFEDVPVLQIRNESPRHGLSLVVGFLVAASATLALLWAASGYLRAAVSVSEATGLADQFKLAGLIFALLFLFEKLFYEPVPQRVLAELLELRRAYFFSEMDTNSAIYELKKLLGRLNPKEFVDGISEVYVETLDKYEWTVGKATESLYIHNEKLPEGIEGLEGIPLADSISRELSRIYGSEENLACVARIAAAEGRQFDKELRRAKQFLSFELNEFTWVEKDIEARKIRIDEKLSHFRSEQARINQPIEPSSESQPALPN